MQYLTSHQFYYYLLPGLPAFLFTTSTVYPQHASHSESWKSISQIMAEDPTMAPHFSQRKARTLTMAYTYGVLSTSLTSAPTSLLFLLPPNTLDVLLLLYIARHALVSRVSSLLALRPLVRMGIIYPLQKCITYLEH